LISDENLYANSQLDTFSRFDTIPACDRQTEEQTHDDAKNLRHIDEHCQPFVKDDIKMVPTRRHFTVKIQSL